MTDTTTNAKTDRVAVASHELITAPGGEHTADMTTAIGIRYTDKASGEKFEYFPDGENGKPNVVQFAEPVRRPAGPHADDLPAIYDLRSTILRFTIIYDLRLQIHCRWQIGDRRL